MPVERSAGIILFRNTPQGRKYLVLRASGQNPKWGRFWDFPKGRLEKGETGVEAAMREAKEEVGIEEFEIIPEFKNTIRYFTWREGKRIPKFVALFLAETNHAKVELSWEHDKYLWLLYPEARQRLSLPQMKKALEEAEKHLKTLKY